MQRQVNPHRYGLAVFDRRREFPLFDRYQGCVVKGIRGGSMQDMHTGYLTPLIQKEADRYIACKPFLSCGLRV